MRKPSVGTAHILNVNVHKNSDSVDVGMQEEMGHFFGGNIKFLRYAYVKLRLPPPYAIKYYVPHDSRSLSITHAMIMVIIRVM